MPDSPHLRVVEPENGAASARRATYSEAFKREAVRRVRDGQPIAQAARELDVSRNTLKAWVADAPVDFDSDLPPLRGKRIDVLRGLHVRVATVIDDGVTPRNLPPVARLLMDISKEIESIDARTPDAAEPVIADGPFDYDSL